MDAVGGADGCGGADGPSGDGSLSGSVSMRGGSDESTGGRPITVLLRGGRDEYARWSPLGGGVTTGASEGGGGADAPADGVNP